MRQRIAEAGALLLARYEGGLRQSVAQGGASSSSSSSSARMVARATSSRSSPPASLRPVAPSSSPPPAAPLRRDLPAVAERRGRLLAMVDDAPVLYGDVLVDAWYAPYVAALITEGIAQGYKDTDGNLTGTFGVAEPVTRAEMLKMALEAAGVTLHGGSPRNGSARDTWASPYVAEAERLHLSLFQPLLAVHAPATRGEVVQTVLEVLRFPLLPPGRTPFADVPEGHRFSRAVATAAAYAIVSGDTAPDGSPRGIFRPDDPITRAEVAKIIALVRGVMQ